MLVKDFFKLAAEYGFYPVGRVYSNGSKEAVVANDLQDVPATAKGQLAKADAYGWTFGDPAVSNPNDEIEELMITLEDDRGNVDGHPQISSYQEVVSISNQWARKYGIPPHKHLLAFAKELFKQLESEQTASLEEDEVVEDDEQDDGERKATVVARLLLAGLQVKAGNPNKARRLLAEFEPEELEDAAEDVVDLVEQASDEEDPFMLGEEADLEEDVEEVTEDDFDLSPEAEDEEEADLEDDVDDVDDVEQDDQELPPPAVQARLRRRVQASAESVEELEDDLSDIVDDHFYDKLDSAGIDVSEATPWFYADTPGDKFTVSCGVANSFTDYSSPKERVTIQFVDEEGEPVGKAISCENLAKFKSQYAAACKKAGAKPNAKLVTIVGNYLKKVEPLFKKYSSLEASLRVQTASLRQRSKNTRLIQMASVGKRRVSKAVTAGFLSEDELNAMEDEHGYDVVGFLEDQCVAFNKKYLQAEAKKGGLFEAAGRGQSAVTYDTDDECHILIAIAPTGISASFESPTNQWLSADVGRLATNQDLALWQKELKRSTKDKEAYSEFTRIVKAILALAKSGKISFKAP